MLKKKIYSAIILLFIGIIPFSLTLLKSAHAENNSVIKNSYIDQQNESEEKTDTDEQGNLIIDKSSDSKDTITPPLKDEDENKTGTESDSTIEVKPDEQQIEKPDEIDLTPFNILNDLHRSIYSGTYKASEIKKIFFENIKETENIYYRKGGENYTREQWIFPVAGYNHKTTLLDRRDFKYQKKYNYFSSRASTDHPAFDLFIRDKNFDLLDDKTGLPVNILSVTGGTVIACIDNWGKGLYSSGGNNILIYDPYYQAIFYYAHNNLIFVKPGDVVKPGDIIASMGRTGKNAIKKRSPTHLHIAYLQIKKNNLIPVNIFKDLKKMIIIK